MCEFPVEMDLSIGDDDDDEEFDDDWLLGKNVSAKNPISSNLPTKNQNSVGKAAGNKKYTYKFFFYYISMLMHRKQWYKFLINIKT